MLNDNLKNIYKRVSTDLEVNKDSLGSFKNVLAIALSGMTYTIIEQLNKSKEILPTQAKGSTLDSWGTVYGVKRVAPKKAEIVVNISTKKALFVASEPLTFSDQITQAKFESDKNIEIKKGAQSIKVTALEAGFVNLERAYIGLNTTHDSIETTVSFNIVSQGQDAEPDDAYRKRILNRIIQIPQSGTVADFIKWVEDGDPKIKAFVKPAFQGAGTVGITFLQKIGEYFTPPEKTKVDSTKKKLESLAPATTEITFIPPKKRDVKIQFTLDPEDSKVRAEITNKIKDFFNKNTEVFGFKNKECQGTRNIIWKTKIAQILGASGYNTTLHEPSQNIFLKENEFAVPKF